MSIQTNIKVLRSEDRPSRQEWNDAMAQLATALTTLDAAIEGRCRIYTGQYTGNGQAGRVISLGITPLAVIVKIPRHHNQYGFSNEVNYVPAIALRECGCEILSVVSGGFQLTDHGLVNGQQSQYIYIAFYQI